MSPLKYVAHYNERVQALMKAQPGLREYHNGSITATIGLSFDQLKKQNPSAAAFLLLCACLDNSAISFPLFHASAQPQDQVEDDDSEIHFDDLPLAAFPKPG